MERIDAVRVFVVAAQTGTVTEAARRLGLTVAAVSKALSGLERRHSVSLFRRSNRGIWLTAEGRRYFERCRLALEELADAEAELTRSVRELRGPCRVDLPILLGERMLLPLLSEFSQTHPGVALDVRLNDRITSFGDDSVDLAVRFGTLADSQLRARPLGKTRYVAFASPDYLARRKIPRSPDDLKEHDCVVYVSQESRRPFEWRFRKGNRKRSFVPEMRLVVDSGHANIGIALEGWGIGFDLSFAVLGHVQAGRLRLLLTDWSAEGPPVSLVTPGGVRQPDRVKVLAAFLAERVTESELNPELP